MEKKEILRRLALYAAGKGSKAITAEHTLKMIQFGQVVDAERIVTFLDNDINLVQKKTSKENDADALKQRIFELNDLVKPLVEQYMDYCESERDAKLQHTMFEYLDGIWKRNIKDKGKHMATHYSGYFEKMVIATLKMVTSQIVGDK